MRRKWLRNLIVLLTFAVLCACGGGGSSNGTDDNASGGDITTGGDTTGGDTTDILNWPYNVSKIIEEYDTDSDGVVDKTQIYEFSYNEINQVTSWRYYTEGESDEIVHDIFIYDLNGYLTEIQGLEPFSFQLDENGNITKGTETDDVPAEVRNYLYDENGYIKTVYESDGESYARYDYSVTPDGVILSFGEYEDLNGDGSYEYKNQGITFTYDNSGNLAEINDDVVWKFYYSGENVQSVEIESETDGKVKYVSEIIEIYYNSDDKLDYMIWKNDFDGNGVIDQTKKVTFLFNDLGAPKVDYGYAYPLYGKYKVNVISDFLAFISSFAF